MCGIAEATLAITAISAIVSYADSQQQAKAEQNRQRRIDQAAYDNYQLNLASIDDKREEYSEQAADLSVEQAVEKKHAEGKTRVHFGEMGLGQFSLTGNSTEAVFGDILLQAATGTASRRKDLSNIYRSLDKQAEASYLGYAAQNASFAPIFSQSIFTPIAKIAGAGTDYMGDSSRKHFKDPSGGFTPNAMFG